MDGQLVYLVRMLACFYFVKNGGCLLDIIFSYGQVWQMEWDMSGMTLATTGSDGKVRLWQSNLNGVWHEQAAFEPTT